MFLPGLSGQREVPDWGRQIFSAGCLCLRPSGPEQLAGFVKYAIALHRAHILYAYMCDPVEDKDRWGRGRGRGGEGKAVHACTCVHVCMPACPCACTCVYACVVSRGCAPLLLLLVKPSLMMTLLSCRGSAV